MTRSTIFQRLQPENSMFKITPHSTQTLTHAHFHTTSVLNGKKYHKLSENTLVSFTMYDPSAPIEGFYTSSGFVTNTSYSCKRLELTLNRAIGYLRRCNQDWLMLSLQIKTNGKTMYLFGDKSSDREIPVDCAKLCLLSYREFGLKGLPNTIGRKFPHISNRE